MEEAQSQVEVMQRQLKSVLIEAAREVCGLVGIGCAKRQHGGMKILRKLADERKKKSSEGEIESSRK